MAAGGFAAAERIGDLAKIQAENIVQQERPALERRQPFQRQHQGVGEIVRKIAGTVRRAARPPPR